MKSYMCIEECQIVVEVKGKLCPKRFRFGERIKADTKPNKYFTEIKVEDFDKSPRDVLISLIEQKGLDYHDEMTDFTLRTIYIENMRQAQKQKVKIELLAKARKIKAKWHPSWNIYQLKASITEKEAELYSDGLMDEVEELEAEERRKSLLAKAKEIGATVHHLWKVEKIEAAIEEKEAASN